MVMIDSCFLSSPAPFPIAGGLGMLTFCGCTSAYGHKALGGTQQEAQPASEQAVAVKTYRMGSSFRNDEVWHEARTQCGTDST